MKRIVSIFILISIISSTVFAATDLKSQLNSTASALTDKKSQLNSVKKDKKLTLGDIESLDKQIGNTQTQIEYLEYEIKTLEKEILVSEENIKYQEEKYNEKEEIRQERLLTYYKKGTVSFWDSLLDSEGITDFFYRYSMMERIVEYDNNLLKELEEEKKEIEAIKCQLEENKVLCEDKKASAEDKRAALGETKEVRKTYLAKLEKTEDLLESSIDELQKKADELTEEIRKQASSSTTSKYTGGTMSWPLPGYYGISSYFGNRLHPVLKVYKMHTGVDIAGSGCNGKNIVAAADGTVITSGWISGYGYTVVIDHGGGVVTLYAHSQKLLVNKGDKVKKGQAIMLVGSTGYATGPHLHFEVRINGNYVNPLDGYISKK